VLNVFVRGPGGLVRTEAVPDAPLPDDALWFALYSPTPAEKQRVEQALGIEVPTLDEMREIEASNRLYEENGALHLTATVVTTLDTGAEARTQVTFILTGTHLVTTHYTELLPFRRFIAFAETHPAACSSAALLLAGLLEAIINRIADLLEKVGSDVETISARVFTRYTRPHDFRVELRQIGEGGELVSKARESLVSLARLLGFLRQSTNSQLTPEARASLGTVARDVEALSGHVTFLGEKVQFLLDATLGMVTIDQNNILKIFSIVAVLLLPPAIVTGYYGMNFENIPALHTHWGVWLATILMVASALLPYWYFRRKGWL
jgi:magnesium transporter